MVAWRQAMMDAVTIPVIASSGAGSAEHFSEVFQVTGVQAVSLWGTGEEGKETKREGKKDRGREKRKRE